MRIMPYHSRPFGNMKPLHLVTLLVAVLLLYALSSGPVLRIDRTIHPHNWLPSDGVLWFYHPLGWLGDYAPPVGVLLQFYVQLWLPSSSA